MRKIPSAGIVDLRVQTTLVYEPGSNYHRGKNEQICNCTGCPGRLLLYQKLIDKTIQYPNRKTEPNPTSNPSIILSLPAETKATKDRPSRKFLNPDPLERPRFNPISINFFLSRISLKNHPILKNLLS